jgi:hypothetical protein
VLAGELARQAGEVPQVGGAHRHPELHRRGDEALLGAVVQVAMASLLVVALVLMALTWLCLPQPRRSGGCCGAGAWPPDDLAPAQTDARTASEPADRESVGSRGAAADGA